MRSVDMGFQGHHFTPHEPQIKETGAFAQITLIHASFQHKIRRQTQADSSQSSMVQEDAAGSLERHNHHLQAS